MALTPEDVSSKRFTPVKLREGYNMAEVDAFLDEVEAELARLLAENESLRKGAGASTGDDGDTGSATPKAPTTTTPAAATATAKDSGEDQPATPAASGTTRPRPSEQIKVTTAAEAGAAATRLLELATRNADQVVAEAEEQAATIVGSARTDAESLRARAQEETEKLKADTRTEADRVAEEARGRSQRLDEETEGRRRAALEDVEREKSRLDAEVDTLRAFEREYRSRLRSYFTQQLEALDSEGGELEGGSVDGGDGPAPKRLKSILGAASEHVQGQARQGDAAPAASPTNAPAEQEGAATPGEEQPRS
ncbi:cell wall synthesis protein Wag31 [Nocardioides korecus]